MPHPPCTKRKPLARAPRLLLISLVSPWRVPEQAAARRPFLRQGRFRPGRATTSCGRAVHTGQRRAVASTSRDSVVWRASKAPPSGGHRKSAQEGVSRSTLRGAGTTRRRAAPQSRQLARQARLLRAEAKGRRAAAAVCGSRACTDGRPPPVCVAAAAPATPQAHGGGCGRGEKYPTREQQGRTGRSEGRTGGPKRHARHRPGGGASGNQAPRALAPHPSLRP